MANKALVGEKVGMTQVWDDDHRVVPVTVVRVTPLRVVQIKTPERDGYSALQVTKADWLPERATTFRASHRLVADWSADGGPQLWQATADAPP